MKAECSTCHKTITLNSDGSLRRHGDGLYRGVHCDGAPLLNRTVIAAGETEPRRPAMETQQVEHGILAENYSKGIASVTCMCGATIRVEDGTTGVVELVRMARMIYEDHMVVARVRVAVVR